MLSSGEDQVGYVDVEKVNVALVRGASHLVEVIESYWGSMRRYLSID